MEGVQLAYVRISKGKRKSRQNKRFFIIGIKWYSFLKKKEGETEKQR